MNYMDAALADVRVERLHQVHLKAQGRFRHTLNDPELTDGERLATIVEEVGEVARNVLARTGAVSDGEAADGPLRKELTQIAALAVAWMERL